MLNFDPRAWGIDPQKLEELKRIARRIHFEVRVGVEGNRGRFQVVFTAPEDDEEAWRKIDEWNEAMSKDLAEKLFIVFEMKGKRTYVRPPQTDHG
jgi:hypothetical protein